MKAILTSVLVLATVNAYADYASIECGSVQLSLDETSDVNLDTLTLSVKDKAVKASRLSVTETDYGILAISVQASSGSAKKSYRFKNLGSGECFGVFGSRQKGTAYVEVVNSLDKVTRLNCQCSQD